MEWNYDITEEIYTEVIAYQMRLHNNTIGQLTKLYVPNFLFCCMAIYFYMARTEYSSWLRLLPLVMSAVLIVISVVKRGNLMNRAKAALKKYMQNGILTNGYIGSHTLILEKGIIKRQYGKESNELFCRDISACYELENALLLIAQGVIFEVIPLKALSFHGKEKLLEAIWFYQEKSMPYNIVKCNRKGKRK